MNITEFIDSFRVRVGRMPAVGFVGLGVSNLSIIEVLGGYPVTLRSLTPPKNETLSGINLSKLAVGEGYLSDIYEDILILSPSVRRDRPELVLARERGVILTSDSELFFLDCNRRIYAVTGSDGKSTTATLTSLLLKEKYPECELLGNIGVPFSCSVGNGPAVAELSSFQLSYLKPRCTSAVITTLTPNHLDWHASQDEYVRAKLNITELAERTVMSPDTDIERELIPSVSPDVIYSSKLRFSELYGTYSARHYITAEDGYIMVDGEMWLRTDLAKRRERHNLHNLMGAMGAALGEFSREHLSVVAESFCGLAHRMEIVPVNGGVNFINSSIDTTPARVKATLESLDRRVRIIMGGRGKRLSLDVLIPALRKYAERISVYGEVRREYLDALSASGIDSEIECLGFERLGDAIEHATEGVRDGDTVILSPAATGYGEFSSFAERGEYFKEYIKNKYKG